MFASGKDIGNLASNLNDTLLTISELLNGSGLCINVKKRQIIWYGIQKAL